MKASLLLLAIPTMISLTEAMASLEPPKLHDVKDDLENSSYTRKVEPQKKFSNFYESNKNGNPSFDIETPLEKAKDDTTPGQKFGRCGATRVKADGCVIMTAAHCVDDHDGKTISVKAPARRGDAEANPTKSFTVRVLLNETYSQAHQELKGKEQVTKSTTPSGREATHIFVPGEKPFDVALMMVDDPAFCADMVSVPICDKKPVPGDPLFLGSSWQGKLLSAEVDDAAKSPKGDWTSVNIAEASGGISQGDSGSGMFMRAQIPKRSGKPRERSETSLCLAGALSGSAQKKKGMEWTANKDYPDGKKFHLDASYAADKAMDWVKSKITNTEKPETKIRKSDIANLLPSSRGNAGSETGISQGSSVGPESKNNLTLGMLRRGNEPSKEGSENSSKRVLSARDLSLGNAKNTSNRVLPVSKINFGGSSRKPTSLSSQRVSGAGANVSHRAGLAPKQSGRSITNLNSKK